MNILAIETSTDKGSLSFFQSSDLVWEMEVSSGRHHNTQVLEALEQQLTTAPDLILIGSGPGNYTGIRVAISIAQGIQVIHQSEVIALPSLFCALSNEPKTVIGNARRGEFYHTEVSTTHGLSEIQVLTEEALVSLLKKNAPQEVALFEEDEKTIAILNSLTIPFQIITPHASTLIHQWQALSKDIHQECQQTPLEPVYLRPPSMEKSTKPHPLLSL